MPGVQVRKEARPRSGPELRRAVPDMNYMERLPTERSLPEISPLQLEDSGAATASASPANNTILRVSLSPLEGRGGASMKLNAEESSVVGMESTEGSAETVSSMPVRSESYQALQEQLERTSKNQDRIRKELQDYLLGVKQRLEEAGKEEDLDLQGSSPKSSPKALQSTLAQLVLSKCEDLPKDDCKRLHEGLNKIERLDSILQGVEAKVDASPNHCAAASSLRPAKPSNLSKKVKKRRKKRVKRASTKPKPDPRVSEKEGGRNDIVESPEVALVPKSLLTEEEQTRLAALMEEGEVLLITDGKKKTEFASGFDEAMGAVDKKLRELLGEEEWQKKVQFISGSKGKGGKKGSQAKHKEVT